MNLFRKTCVRCHRKMMETKLFRHKKGVSPTVSAIMMVAITVMAMTVVVTFGLNFINARNTQMGERLSVEKVLFYSNISIRVYVRNIGHGDLTLLQAKVNNKLYNLFQGNTVVIPTDGRFVTINLSPSLPKGVYTISFITSRYNELGLTEVEYK